MRTRFIVYSLIAMLAGAVAGVGYYAYTVQKSVDALRQTIAVLDTQLADASRIASSTAAVNSAVVAAENARRQQVVAKSQDQLLQEAVAKVAPAVVSIVESREVPLLKVTYENPFGNDPFFEGFGIQVPVYQQVGTTTQKISAGTGFLVRSSGYIVTNRHVVPDSDSTYTVLLSNGQQKNGTVVWRSQTEDLAVLKIQGSGYASVPLGDSTALKLGESVFAVGNALGEYSNSVSVGIVSGLNRTITAATSGGGSETLKNVIQTDAAINPGNSGGPLSNLTGQVVGVNVATVQGSQSIGFSIPISKVKTALANLGI